MAGRILVLEDEAVLCRALTTTAAAFGTAIATASAVEAERLFDDGTAWVAAIIGTALPDGNGLDVLSRARQMHASMPALVLTARVDAATANVAHDLRAHFLVKPCNQERVRRFLAEATSPPALERVIQDCIKQSRIPDAEAEVLRGLVVEGLSLEQVAFARGRSVRTVRKQAETLRARTGDASVHALIERLLRESLRLAETSADVVCDSSFRVRALSEADMRRTDISGLALPGLSKGPASTLFGAARARQPR